MPLTPQILQLAQGFSILFDPELAPATTEDSARQWAKAYTNWVVAGGVGAAKAKESVLAAALTVAFNPELAGAGPGLLTKALSSFWMGLPVPEQLSIVVAVIPTGSVNSSQPDNATPEQQAQGLAQVISAFTLGAVKVQLTAPPNTVLPLI